MAIAAATGNGGTITFSGLSGNVVSISSVEMEVEDIEVSHLGTTGQREYIPSDLVEGGEVEVEYLFSGVALPTLGDVQTLTITFPTTPGGSTGATLVGTAYVKSVGYPEVTSADVLSNTTVFKFNGDTDAAFTAQS
jgi:hypothetical protein